MVLFVKDNWIWMPHLTEAYIPVQMMEQQGDKITVRNSFDEQFQINLNDNLNPVHQKSLLSLDNLVDLEELSEGAILHNLRCRYEKNIIYTYISSIVLSINPYKLLGIYGPNVIQKYRKILGDPSAKPDALSPHVYALADAAYKSLVMDNQDQSVIISGESGAGKTEATKLVLQYLADTAGSGDDIEQQILEANPIIEAFGNAKTVRNNNSSRFGKWIQIYFNEKNKINGSKIYNYLLEKSRVVLQAEGERNYHIFYAFLQGSSSEEKSRYKLTQISDYSILKGGNCFSVEGINDGKNLSEVQQALAVLKFGPEITQNIFATLAAILHIGNIQFSQSAEEKSSVTTSAELEIAAQLLGISAETLNSALTTRKLLITGEADITTFQTELQAADTRNTLCKALYDCLFNCIIDKINQTLFFVQNHSNKSIGVLDIFGFECFAVNYFEQFLINYANERLQQHFNEYCFQLEQKEYSLEEISVPAVQFVDNQACLDLIDKRKMGIIDLIQEEIKLPKGSDANLLQRMHNSYNNNAFYGKPRLGGNNFIIKHYAGAVEYTVTLFLNKSKDNLDDSLAEALESSSNHFIAKILENGKRIIIEQVRKGSVVTQLLSPPPQAHSRSGGSIGGDTLSPLLPSSLPNSASFGQLSPQFSSSNRGRSPTADISNTIEFLRDSPTLDKPSSSSSLQARRGQSRLNAPALASQFRAQLGDLLATLNSTKPHFVRCIKPNSLKISDNFDAQFVLKQLQYLGIAEVIKIRQLGYPVRRLHHDFVQRYKILLGNSNDKADPVQQCTQILNLSALGINNQDWRSGKTKILMKNNVQNSLETARERRLIKIVTNLQARYRAKRLRIRYKLLRACVNKVKLMLQESKEDDVEIIDVLIAEAVELSVPVQLLTNLKKFRHRVNEVKIAKQSLLTAISSKNISLIEKSLQSATAINLDESCTEYVQAKQLFQRLSAYINQMKAAIEQKNLEEITKQLAIAAELQLDSSLEREAKQLKQRLIEENNMIADLTSALTERDLERLISSIKKAETMGFSHASLIQAQELRFQLEKERQALANLTAAMQANDIELIQSAIVAANSLGISQQHSVIQQATAHKSQLTTKKKVAEIEVNLNSAITSKNIAVIQSALKQARENNANAQLINKAEQAIKAVELSHYTKEKLTAALESGKLEAISAAVTTVEEAKLTEELATEYNAAVQLKAKMNNILTELKSKEQQSVEKLDSLLQQANSIGFSSAIEEVKAQRHALLEKQEIEKDLMTAIQTKQEAILFDIIHKTQKKQQNHVNFDGKLLEQAKQLLDNLIAERTLHEQEIAAAEQQIKEEQKQRRNSLKGAPTAESQAEEEKSQEEAEEQSKEFPVSPREEEVKMEYVVEANEEAEDTVSPIHIQAASHTIYVNSKMSVTVSPARDPKASENQQTSPNKQAISARKALLTPFDPNPYLAKNYVLHLFSNLRAPDDFAKGKLFGKSKLKASMLVWSKEIIPRSLTKLGEDKDELNNQAINIFKSLQGFMLDRMYSFPDSLASSILEIGLHQEQLRDEIYLQIIKQIQTNPKPEAVLRGFQLLGLAAETFRVSNEFRPHLFNWILTSPYKSQADYIDYIQFTIRTLHKQATTGTAPSIDHITAFRDRVMKTKSISIKQADGTEISIDIDPSVNCQAAIKMLSEILGLRDVDLSTMALYECGPGPEEFAIQSTECLLDCQAAKIRDESMWFLFKKHLFLEGAADKAFGDAVALNIIYHQCLYDSCHSVYNLTREELIEIVAHHYKLIELNYFPSLGTETPKSAAIKRIQPEAFVLWSQKDQLAFLSQISARQGKLTAGTVNPRAVIEILMQKREFGAELFLVKQDDQKGLPDLVLLGVNNFGVVLINEDTKVLLNSFKFAHITGWANNSVRFCLRVLVSKGKAVQMNFATTQGKMITQAVQNYVDALVKLKNRKI
jgi:myosin heavy subunit